jgi:hypothetical protein
LWVDQAFDQERCRSVAHSVNAMKVAGDSEDGVVEQWCDRRI